MEAIRKVIDSDLISDIIPLPSYFKNKQVEVIVCPPDRKEDKTLPRFSMTEIDEMMKNSVTESLIGSIPNRGLSLDEYRTERLNKYEAFG
jgi:hypothetical protein